MINDTTTHNGDEALPLLSKLVTSAGLKTSHKLEICYAGPHTAFEDLEEMFTNVSDMPVTTKIFYRGEILGKQELLVRLSFLLNVAAREEQAEAEWSVRYKMLLLYQAIMAKVEEEQL